MGINHFLFFGIHIILAEKSGWQVHHISSGLCSMESIGKEMMSLLFYQDLRKAFLKENLFFPF